MNPLTHKSRTFTVIAVVAMVLPLNWCCKKGPLCNCFVPAGPTKEETRTVPFFNQVDVNDNINVLLSTGPQEQVLVQGGKHLIKYIAAQVSSGVLILKNNNRCNWMRSYEKSHINVYITMPNFTYITNEGVGDIKSMDTLVADSFQVQTKSAGNVNLLVRSKYINTHLFGSGDLTLAGTTSTFTCAFYSGTGFLYCENLITSGYAFIASSTTGDCYISSNGILDVTIYKNGNVYYSGKPQEIWYKHYGKGQLIPN